ncbi:hypothetical protein IW261DRAFT_253334 [Armillaria novae-zelandiae]|uniref:Uncharacterized protein n=1 Tax=Armillaria novae-zelandiae TaxID=153914 RepID=A0AA39P5B5_9AGAR|nr:hypothetical protein IW261DRAFT_253334 [Armillaria novae-zelandiae]
MDPPLVSSFTTALFALSAADMAPNGKYACKCLAFSSLGYSQALSQARSPSQRYAYIYRFLSMKIHELMDVVGPG